MLPDTFEAQFGNVVVNIKRVLSEVGATLRDLVKVDVLADAQVGRAAMSALYISAFGPTPYPARTTCMVHALPQPQGLTEIEHATS